MAHHASAVPERIRWTVDLLDVGPADRLLEIGCGPGHAVALVCARLKQGTITAIDRSALQVSRARERNRQYVAAGRARIEQATLTEFNAEERFDKVFAINVNAFWTAPPPTIAGVRRLLEPNGRAYLTYEPPTSARLVPCAIRCPGCCARTRSRSRTSASGPSGQVTDSASSDVRPERRDAHALRYLRRCSSHPSSSTSFSSCAPPKR